jgi:hypothetical protein
MRNDIHHYINISAASYIASGIDSDVDLGTTIIWKDFVR